MEDPRSCALPVSDFPERDVALLRPRQRPGMEQETGAASAGTLMSLNEREQRFYSGLHRRCRADASGKLSSGKVAELFKASQLPPESLHQVSESRCRDV